MSDKYRIVSSIGAGNSSRVFLAEHRKLKAYRAVKCMKKTADEKCPQFLLEADLLKNLKHPGIPTIYDVEEDNENYYIIEEYIQGQSLEAYVLYQDCISIDTAVCMALQICDVIKYLHGQQPEPVIYQDLKPEHIILCGKRIVLIDFGISSYITTGGNTFQNFGTEGFAPPEKYQGIPCDFRADIYSIGKILLYMAEKIPPQEFQYLKPFVEKAAAYSREERYPSIEALETDLNGLQRDIDQFSQHKQNEHLLSKITAEIAVAGSQRRVGTTHFAISLTCFLNQIHKNCMYQEYHDSDCIRLLAEETGSFTRKDGSVAYEKFRGMPFYGEGIAKKCQENGLYVQDYGIQVKELSEQKKRWIVVMGTRQWEMEQTKKMIAKISMCENLVLVCNYGDRAQAKWIARTYHRRVYCFPLDADPFRMTGEKRRFFQKLLRQEGW